MLSRRGRKSVGDSTLSTGPNICVMKQTKRLKQNGKKATLDKDSIIVLSFFGLVVLGIIAYNVWNNTSPSTWVSMDEQLPNNKVCMVNDTYMGVDQIEVPVADKMYYGCCEMCVDKLNTLESVRFGIDPFTGEKVDKADAFIVLKSKSTGAVHYFESKDTFEQYKKESEN